MKNWLIGMFFLISLLYAGGVNAQEAPLKAFDGLKGTLKIAGGTAHIPVMEEVAKRVMTYNPDIQVSIAGGGSGIGIKQVGEGLVDIGNSGRRPKDKEISRYNLRLFKWAIDGIAVVVHKDNMVSNLSKDQIKDIFSGKISNWKALGGADRKINVYTRDAGSGTRKVFWKKALDKGPIVSSANFVKSNGAMKVAISSDSYGIGYISVGHLDETVKGVSIDGVSPTLKNIEKGDYKIARGLYSLTKGEPNPLASAFINYLYSEPGQKIIEKKGFIPVK